MIFERTRFFKHHEHTVEKNPREGEKPYLTVSDEFYHVVQIQIKGGKRLPVRDSVFYFDCAFEASKHFKYFSRFPNQFKVRYFVEYY